MSAPSPERKLHLLVASTGARDTSWAEALVVRLSNHPYIVTRALVDDVVPRLTQTVMVTQNRGLPLTLHGERSYRRSDRIQDEAFKLASWADVMVCAPLDAEGIVNILEGRVDSLLGDLIRRWHPAKEIMLAPGMSKDDWARSTTQMDMSRLQTEWPHIRTLAPILWQFESETAAKRVSQWDGFNSLLQIIENRVKFIQMQQSPETDTSKSVPFRENSILTRNKLPPELWTMILNLLDDWELAEALGVYTSTPRPEHWATGPANPEDKLEAYHAELMWTILHCDSKTICEKLSSAPQDFVDLPPNFTRLVIRFNLVNVLEYMKTSRPDLYTVFNSLPVVASAVWPRLAILDHWKSNLDVEGRLHNITDAVDGASENGHVHVLEWWHSSGLWFTYSFGAFFQASKNGHVPVLEWWRQASEKDSSIYLGGSSSLAVAAEQGRLDVLRWWHAKGIRNDSPEEVARWATLNGRVEVLDLWLSLMGLYKFDFPVDVIVLATKSHSLKMLDWWRSFMNKNMANLIGPPRGKCKFYPPDIARELLGAPEAVMKWWKDHYNIDGGNAMNHPVEMTL